MAIPDYQTLMLPLLKLVQDKKTYNIHEVTEILARDFKLTEDEVIQLLPSGTQSTFYNRVGWARTYLLKAGLIESPQRGCLKITERGLQILLNDVKRIDNSFLRQFPEFINFRKRRNRLTTEDEHQESEQEVLTPEEEIENVYQKIRNNLSEELLDFILKSPPGFFEKLVVDLLVAMGYGGSYREAARAVGRSGDEGIDGIIDEDRLGLDIIYIQAKRWQPTSPISRPQIQEFVGALQGKRAKKGIFITTSRFTNEAKEYTKNIDIKIALLDGEKLTDLMIDFGVGVTSRVRYDVKEIDSDYFGEMIA